ncbi:MAG: hypothetical protein LBG47_05665 [Prevotellaceae bacterium]|nr:hypothetical protein [Prevotellaceae bacterium]
MPAAAKKSRPTQWDGSFGITIAPCRLQGSAQSKACPAAAPAKRSGRPGAGSPASNAQPAGLRSCSQG